MRNFGKVLLATVAVASFGSVAHAADLSAPMAPAAPAYVAPTTSWEGAYIGANIGYGSAHSDHNDINTTVGDFDMTGGFVGGQIGYNFYLSDGVVLGVQGDIDWANITGTDPSNPIGDTINWKGAVTAHLGYAIDSVMPYILGGVAFANSERTGVTSTTDTKLHTGWTVGAGVDVMLAGNVSAFAEYRYADYGTQTYTLPSTPGVGLTEHSVRAGLNFHF